MWFEQGSNCLILVEELLFMLREGSTSFLVTNRFFSHAAML